MPLTPKTCTRLINEVDSAADRFGPQSSPEEVYGVLCEEMAEMLDAIRAHRFEAARAEAVQIAAVALRFADNLTRHEMDGAYAKGAQ